MNQQEEIAGVLVIRNGVNQILKKKGYTADHLLSEQNKLKPDTKYFDKNRKQIFNKQARYNLCFAEKGQK